MTTSGTFLFAPSVGELVINAYGRCQIRGPALVAQHWYDSRTESNLLQIEWQNKGVQLWTIDLQSVPLVQGTPTYNVPSNTMTILDTYITTFAGTQQNDRLILGISRADYAALPNKFQLAPPTAWWFNRLIAPVITVWPVPDLNNFYTLNYYRYRLIQDSVVAGGLAPEMPIRFLDAWTAGLAHRFARLHAPALEAIRGTDAEKAWGIASTQDFENTPVRIQPQIANYYRRR
jgi:hypothetical protein